MCEGEAAVHHQAAELSRAAVEEVMSAEGAGCRGTEGEELNTPGNATFRMTFDLTVGAQSRLELILLEQDLVHGLLDGGEVEVRLRDDDARVCKLHLEHLLSKQVVPHLPLDIPVHQVTLTTTESRRSGLCSRCGLMSQRL